MSASALEVIGALAACGGTGASLLLVAPGRRYVAMGVGLLAALGLLFGEVADQERFDSLISQPGALVLAALLAGTALGATAATFIRVPAAFAIGAFAVLALRLPVQIGDETNSLLVPLYGVIAGGFLRGAWLVATNRGDELQNAASPHLDEPPAVRVLALSLAVFLGVYAIGTVWSDDPTNAVRTVAFFLAPFAALLAMLRDIRWYRKLVGRVLLATGLVALGFAAIAIYQYAARDLLINKELTDANELHLYFRVNSLFRDPNVLGRYLTFALVGTAAWVAWHRPRMPAVAGLAGAAVVMAALALTYSQTSIAALIAGLGMLVWMRLGARGLATGLGLGVAAIVIVLLVGGPTRDAAVDKGRDDLAESSSGRTSLISGGIDLFQAQPFIGQGSGSFAVSFRKEIERIEQPVSHTEPVTVAAELGILGLIPYAAIIASSLYLLLRPWPSRDPVRAGIAACYVALLVHSLGYAGFPIDPATWALLALGLVMRE